MLFGLLISYGVSFALRVCWERIGGGNGVAPQETLFKGRNLLLTRK
jgi:hypothetical protein